MSGCFYDEIVMALARGELTPAELRILVAWQLSPDGEPELYSGYYDDWTRDLVDAAADWLAKGDHR